MFRGDTSFAEDSVRRPRGPKPRRPFLRPSCTPAGDMAITFRAECISRGGEGWIGEGGVWTPSHMGFT